MGTTPVSKPIKLGQTNLVSLFFINHSGPGGLMGRVKLLARDREP